MIKTILHFQICNPVENCTPTQHADIAFIVDASSSVGIDNWQLVLRFMNEVIDSMVIGDDNVRVGVVLYATRVEYAISLLEYNTPTEMHDMILVSLG